MEVGRDLPVMVGIAEGSHLLRQFLVKSVVMFNKNICGYYKPSSNAKKCSQCIESRDPIDAMLMSERLVSLPILPGLSAVRIYSSFWIFLSLHSLC